MQEATAADMSIANGSTHAEDRRLHVVFSHVPVKNEEKSTAAGRPIFEDKPYITIRVPGDKDNVVFRPYWDDENHPMSDATRFGDRYAKWLAKEKDATTGTPLAAIGVTPSQAAEFGYLGVATVEQLAGLADSNAQKFMSGMGLRQKARDFISAAEKRAPTEQLRAELAKRDEQIATLSAAIKEQAEQMQHLQKKGKA